MTDERQTTIEDFGAMEEEPEIEPAAEAAIDIPVHPVAALFPMLSGRELDDLAQDIKENGLLHPIVLDADGRIVDGRNRYVGCQRAEVKPRFESLNGEEPVAFILSQNVARRHLTKGQQAMVAVVAILQSEITDSVISRGWVERVVQKAPLGRTLVTEACIIFEHARDLVDPVIAGATRFQGALEIARRRRQEAQSEESKLTRLRSKYPDLATMVQEGELSLAAATVEAAERTAAEQKRKEEERQSRVLLAEQWNTILLHLDPRQIDPDEYARSWSAADPVMLPFAADFSAARVRRAADTLARIAVLKEAEDNGNS